MINSKKQILLFLLTFYSLLLYSCDSNTQSVSQTVNVAPNAPVDQPLSADAKLEQAMQPYMQQAKQTYPEAKKRFLAGLPPKESFFITTRLQDNTGKSEQVFIAVSNIKNGTITGVIWNDIQFVSGYKKGDKYSFPESQLLDWTITKPDGTEEGNFVGKFLDKYQNQQ